MSTPWSIRLATVSDAPGLAYAHLKSWQTAYRGIFSDAYLDGIMDGVSRRTERWVEVLTTPEAPGGRHFVAEVPGEGIVGFSGSGGARGEHDGHRGELYAIYLIAPYRGLGIGRALFSNALSHIQNLGHERCMCWVIDANPACGFYQAMGGAVLSGMTKDAVIAGTMVREIAYGWDVGTTVSLLAHDP